MITILTDCAIEPPEGVPVAPLSADPGAARGVVFLLDGAGAEVFAACRPRIAALREQGVATAEAHMTNLYVDGGREPHPPHGQLGADIFVCGFGADGLTVAIDGLTAKLGG